MKTLTIDEFLRSKPQEIDLIGYYWVRFNPGRHGMWEIAEFIGPHPGYQTDSGFKIGGWRYDKKNVMEIYPEKILIPSELIK